jgi:hypothetical protein
MAGIPWWVWVILVLVALGALFARANRSWRTHVRREFVEHLAHEAPD